MNEPHLRPIHTFEAGKRVHYLNNTSVDNRSLELKALVDMRKKEKWARDEEKRQRQQG